MRNRQPLASVPLWSILLTFLLAPASPIAFAGEGPRPAFRTYDSPYYTIHTDLEPNAVREVWARLTAMAEEYHERTKGFAGAIRSKRPFYLFRDEEDYRKAGGPKGSNGVYTGDRLMAAAGARTGGRLWHVIQHEGFHQFVHQVMTGRLPVWVDEGLAEYFGEGVWTGDGMVTGVIPPGRLKRIRRLIQEANVLPFADMLDMTRKEWGDDLDVRNYDQAWSMVQFLVAADGGKYCQAFVDYINDVARGGSVRTAFQARFGRDSKAFQSRYEQWWAALGEDATSDRYDEAATATLTSFLARAEYLKKKFDSAEEFLAAVKEGALQVDAEKHPQLWLPVSLGQEAMRRAATAGEWSLDSSKTPPRLVLKATGGTVFTGSFTLSGDQRPKVRVTAEKPKTPATAPAKP